MVGRRERLPDALYSMSPPADEPCILTAVPYYAWANREEGNMLVWIREDRG